MGGRHQSGAPGKPMRWLAGAAGLAIAGAAVFATSSAAGAATGKVSAVFSVTGVSTSNCTVSTGGADVYLKPGDELDVKSSLVGVTALGLPVDISTIASLGGDMVIDPGTDHSRTIAISGKTQAITGLTTGNHTYVWRVDTVTLLVVPIPLKLDAKAVKAGASLAYQGTIHVTNDAAQCGIAVQVPGVSASVSVTGLPPINVSLPPINVSLPVDPGKILSNVPLPGTSSTAANGGGKTKSTGPKNTYTPPGLTIPEEVVPHGTDGGFLGDGGGFFGGALPNLGTGAVGPAVLAPVAPVPNNALPQVTSSPAKKTTKQVELAANKAPSAQLPVVLAIIAIIALSLVTATYARLYLLRR